MPLRIYTEPSDWKIIFEIIIGIVTITLCFILIIISIWFATDFSILPAIFSIIGALFIIKVLRAIRGVR